MITTKNASMVDMDFPNDSFDLIWSEGAIYIMGFRKGLEYWKRLLKPGGAIAVTEVSWLTFDPPEEILKFWSEEYPAITTIDENLSVIGDLGYSVIDHFTLPESAWYQYYRPVEKRVAELREKYIGNNEALEVLDATQVEIDLYRKYSDTYGYVFYILRKSL